MEDKINKLISGTGFYFVLDEFSVDVYNEANEHMGGYVTVRRALEIWVPYGAGGLTIDEMCEMVGA